MNSSMLAAIIALLVSLSATYNAYILRGGRLAWSQVFTALGTVSLMISLVLSESLQNFSVLQKIQISTITFPQLLYILGFLFLFAGSIKLRYSFK